MCAVFVYTTSYHNYLRCAAIMWQASPQCLRACTRAVHHPITTWPVRGPHLRTHDGTEAPVLLLNEFASDCFWPLLYRLVVL